MAGRGFVPRRRVDPQRAFKAQFSWQELKEICDDLLTVQQPTPSTIQFRAMAQRTLADDAKQRTSNLDVA